MRKRHFRLKKDRPEYLVMKTDTILHFNQMICRTIHVQAEVSNTRVRTNYSGIMRAFCVFQIVKKDSTSSVLDCHLESINM